LLFCPHRYAFLIIGIAYHKYINCHSERLNPGDAKAYAIV
jgi:hypothetical protein